MKQCLYVLIATLLFNTAAIAEGVKTGDLYIDHAHARPTVPGQSNGAAYLTIENKGSTSDKLLGISSPGAQSAELHNTVMDGNIMRMREVQALELKPSAEVAMAPGAGYHIMLIGLKQPLTPGVKIPLTLRFEKAGKIDITLEVDGK